MLFYVVFCAHHDVICSSLSCCDGTIILNYFTIYLWNRTSGQLHDQIKSNSCLSDIGMGWALLTDGLHGVFGITEYLCVTNIVLVGAITWWSSAIHVNIIWHAGYSRPLHLVGFMVITLRFDLGQVYHSKCESIKITYSVI